MPIRLDLSRTAVLALDFQAEVVKKYTFDGEECVHRAAQVCSAARRASVTVANVRHGASVSHPGNVDIGDWHPLMEPAPGDLVFVKSRVGAFSTTGLEIALRTRRLTSLVIMGIATSGAVLSSARWAYEVGYDVTVVSDACSDPDPDVHRLLTLDTHPDSWLNLSKQGAVVAADEVVAALGSFRAPGLVRPPDRCD